MWESGKTHYEYKYCTQTVTIVIECHIITGDWAQWISSYLFRALMVHSDKLFTYLFIDYNLILTARGRGKINITIHSILRPKLYMYTHIYVHKHFIMWWLVSCLPTRRSWVWFHIRSEFLHVWSSLSAIIWQYRVLLISVKPTWVAWESRGCRIKHWKKNPKGRTLMLLVVWSFPFPSSDIPLQLC